MRIRIANEIEEPYIKGTMVAPQRKIVILKERKTFRGIKIEELIEEILTHELLHIIIYDLQQDEIIAQLIDNLAKWTLTCEGLRIAFIGKKTKNIIFQTPT